MKSKDTKHLLALCVAISMGWHILGALAIGTVEEPVARIAPGMVPVLSLRPPLEVLNVGVDVVGRTITRPVADEHDPEYFGFPRTWGAWALRRFHQRPETKGQDPMMAQAMEPTKIPDPPPVFEKISRSDAGPDIFEISELMNLPTMEPDMLGLAASQSLRGSQRRSTLAVARRFRGRFATSRIERNGLFDRKVLRHYAPGHDVQRTIPSPGLVLEGPLAARRCLIQVLPTFQDSSMARNRTLVLGQQRRPRGQEGLVIRFWVAPSGMVRFMMLESSSGDQQMDNIAIRAIRQWRFEQIPDASAENQWGRVPWRQAG